MFDLTKMWRSPLQQFSEQIEKAEEVRQQNIGIKKEMKRLHPGAIYTSRLLTNITMGKNFYYFILFYI